MTFSQADERVSMIEPAKIKEVERLLATSQYSQRKIAKLTGVSRAIISDIATGKRPDYEARRAARKEMEKGFGGPPRRCPTCGALVYMPCQLCRVREISEHRRVVMRLRNSQHQEESNTALLSKLLRDPSARSNAARTRLERRSA
jgi:transcriptional regulator with XRE-family HTH domain